MNKNKIINRSLAKSNVDIGPYILKHKPEHQNQGRKLLSQNGIYNSVLKSAHEIMMLQKIKSATRIRFINEDLLPFLSNVVYGGFVAENMTIDILRARGYKVQRAINVIPALDQVNKIDLIAEKDGAYSLIQVKGKSGFGMTYDQKSDIANAMRKGLKSIPTINSASLILIIVHRRKGDSKQGTITHQELDNYGNN